LIILFQASSLDAKEIAISFDDTPRRLTGHVTGFERAKNLVKQLKAAQVTDAVFYCNSSDINSETEKVVQFYSDSGYTIANHTHSHADFQKLSFTDYNKDFFRADKTLSQYSNFSKLFRFPFLREGNEQKKETK